MVEWILKGVSHGKEFGEEFGQVCFGLNCTIPTPLMRA